MSKAEPMDADWRGLHYVLHYTAHAMTPRQRRRWKHKLHRTGEPWPRDGKGRPTPRQRKQVRRA